MSTIIFDTTIFFFFFIHFYTQITISLNYWLFSGIFSPSEFCFNYRSDRGKQEYLALKGRY